MSGNSRYPFISLSKVLVQDKEYVTELEPRLYPKLSVKLYGRGVVLDEPTNGAAVRMKRHQLAQPGQVILSEIWAKKGAIGIVPDEGAGALATSHFFLFDVDESRLLRSYMGWLLSANYFEPVLSGEARGTTGYAAVRPKQFLQCEIPLPLLDEQRRIVARIEALAAKVEVARALRQQAVARTEKLIASVVSDALSDLTADRCLSHVLLESPRNGWSAQCDNAEDGVPVLRLSAVTGFTYQPEEFKRTSQPTSPDAHYWLKKGDLLITRSNTPDLVGHAAIYNGSPSPCIYPDLMMRLVVDENQVDTSFIHWWLRSTLVREYITQNAKGTSPSMKKISQKVVMNIPFPLGIPLDEQRGIVAYLDDLQARVDAVKQHQAATGTALDALLPSILDQAFKGEL